jgi:hypothetical protein
MGHVGEKKEAGQLGQFGEKLGFGLEGLEEWKNLFPFQNFFIFSFFIQIRI